ncbi:hypothetical protein JIN84_09050 [Luteolibacter yonseiensis]|uniref:Uncharacterized protein n=1 Tax=Luteolibacter yonseiensis TaxID=1144680 RepID=A0A934QZT4_9BACT|nr:hypothetical protein [Luteolibacter yonseiensis]MBK1815763.1 hypothetical protein [Luteolibacter yonseiensis]
MSSKTIPKPWRVADLTFIEIEITHPTDRQLRVEFDCGLRLVIADERQIPLAARLIETLRAGKGGLK